MHRRVSAAKGFVLPLDIVRELQPDGRQRHWNVVAVPVVQRCEFLDQDEKGPETDRDVVNTEDQHVVCRRKRHETDPKYRASLEIERALSLAGEPVPQLLVAPTRSVFLLEADL